MKHELARQLVLDIGTEFQFSRAVEMGDDRAVTFEVAVLQTDIVLGLAGYWKLDVTVQGGNDLTSWTDITPALIFQSTFASPLTLPSRGADTSDDLPLPWAYTRLMYRLTFNPIITSGSKVVVMASLETFSPS